MSKCVFSLSCLFLDRMAERPIIGKPPLPKARGQSSNNQNTYLHARDSATTTNQTPNIPSNALPPLRTSHSASLPPIPAASIIHQQQPAYSPLIVHRRSPASTVGSYTHSTTNNVQLLSYQSRPESDYIQEAPRPPRPAPPPSVPIVSSKLLVTDFPVDEEPTKSLPNDTISTAIIERAFDYLPDDDDDDDNDVIHHEDSHEADNFSDSFDDEEEENSVNTHELNPRTSEQLSKTDSKFLLSF